jgi:hypothetical protein
MPNFDVIVDSAISGLRVNALEIFETASGVSVARAAGPVELRVWLPGRDENHNDITVAFAGVLDAGQRVRLRALAQFTELPAYTTNERSYRATLGNDAGDACVVEGPLDSPWATAGPAPVR